MVKGRSSSFMISPVHFPTSSPSPLCYNIADIGTQEQVAGQAIPEIWESSFGLSCWWTITLFIWKMKKQSKSKAWAGKPVEVGDLKKKWIFFFCGCTSARSALAALLAFAPPVSQVEEHTRGGLWGGWGLGGGGVFRWRQASLCATASLGCFALNKYIAFTFTCLVVTKMYRWNGYG